MDAKRGVEAIHAALPLREIAAANAGKRLGGVLSTRLLVRADFAE
jgi:hypothetical protein